MIFNSFELKKTNNKKRQGVIKTLHGDIQTPAFGPDATRGVIKNIAPDDLKKLSTQFLLANTYHLLSYPRPDFIKKIGGLHKLMQWDKPILTDSGGFQIFSLIHGAKNLKGKVDDNGALFKHPHTGKQFKLTPEKAIDIQFAFGSDIMVVLDDCRHYQDHKNLAASVNRSINWAKRCKQQFLYNLDKYFKLDFNQGPRPLIFSVVQGGIDLKLREYCTQELIKIGFDGYGFGGWAINEKEYFPYEVMKFVADLLPEDKPRYAMGVGNPEDMRKCIDFGYDLFDCVIPSRNGRHGLCYTTQGEIKIRNKKYKNDESKLDPNLKSPSSSYPKYFLHHLFKIKDPLGGNLLTLHNLEYFNYVMNN